MSIFSKFSRSGNSNPFGKCDQPLKTEVPEIVKHDFQSIAGFNNVTSGEHLRDLVVKKLYGSVPQNMQQILWQHVCAETDSSFIREILQSHIFGEVHELSLARGQQIDRSGIGTQRG